jgi:cell division protein ZapA (FtsZ GTPase activity inhibitor)
MLQSAELNDEVRHDIILFSRKCASFEEQLHLLSKMDQDFLSVKDKIDSFAQIISNIFEDLNRLSQWDVIYSFNLQDLLSMLLSDSHTVNCVSQEEAFNSIDEHMNSWIQLILSQVANHLTKYDAVMFGVLVCLGLQSYRGRLSRMSYAIARDFISSKRSTQGQNSFFEVCNYLQISTLCLSS